MKVIVTSVLLLALAGCAQPSLIGLDTRGDWAQYGKDSAMQGQRALTQTQINQQTNISAEMWQAYQAGYAEGQEQYCSQNPYWLGRVGKPYLGICDKLDPFFQQNYREGRYSSHY